VEAPTHGLSLICDQFKRGEVEMASKQSPFWNQDAIMAAGLAFAGMAVLQSKLFAAVGWTEWPWLRHLTASHLIQWWPLLLIASGIALWTAKARERRAHKTHKSVKLMGGQRGSRNQY
jgi:hypothetical protein